MPVPSNRSGESDGQFWRRLQREAAPQRCLSVSKINDTLALIHAVDSVKEKLEIFTHCLACKSIANDHNLFHFDITTIETVIAWLQSRMDYEIHYCRIQVTVDAARHIAGHGSRARRARARRHQALAAAAAGAVNGAANAAVAPAGVANGRVHRA